MLIALLLKEGLKSDNHECLVSFFGFKFPELRYETEFIRKLKNLRNRITYEGLRVKKDFVERNILEMNNIINSLRHKLTE